MLITTQNSLARTCTTHKKCRNLVSQFVTSHQPQWICKWDEQISARDYLTGSFHSWWERETSLVLPLDLIISICLLTSSNLSSLSLLFCSTSYSGRCVFYPSCRSPPLAVLLPPSVCSGRGVAVQTWPTYSDLRCRHERACEVNGQKLLLFVF